MATSLLDLVGVLLIGVVGVMSVSFVEGQPPPGPIDKGFAAVGFSGLSAESQIAIVAITAAVVLLAKSIVSPFLMSRILAFLARREALAAARLARELFSRPLTFVQQRSSQETAYGLIRGVSEATTFLLGYAVMAVSEVTLLAMLSVALLLVNPTVAVASIAFFALVALGLHRFLAQRIARLNSTRVVGEIEALNAVQEALGAYREIIVSDRRPLYVERFRALRQQVSSSIAGITMTIVIPKFALEGALVVGAFALAGLLLKTQPLADAVGTLALFLAASTRVMPSLIRLQSAVLVVQGSAAAASHTLSLAEDLGYPLEAPSVPQSASAIKEGLRRGHTDFSPSLLLDQVFFTYPNLRESAVRDITLSVAPGQSLALVGRSGAGKSTLADLILGILQPQSGRVLVGGMSPPEAVRRWPGAVSYVPQDVMLANTSVRANVALGLPRDAIDDDLVWEALRSASLAEYIARQAEGLDIEIGEHGLRLSGGQRQRLGIARALFTKPRLLVLDEATSALDAETEQAVSEMVSGFGPDVTTVVIAHRLSTIRDVDIVVYLEQGGIVASGSFDQVSEQVPALRHQATLMGLRHV